MTNEEAGNTAEDGKLRMAQMMQRGDILDGLAADDPMLFNGQEMIRRGLERKKSSKSQNSPYYCQNNALVWQDVFDVVNRTREPQFIDAAQLGLAVSTLHIRANYALKWLSEKHIDPEQRERWAGIRSVLLLRKVARGIVICHKVQLVMMAMSNKVDEKILGTQGLSFKQTPRSVEVINRAVEELSALAKGNRQVWRGLFFDWVTRAQPGETFRFPTSQTSEGHAFDQADELWLLELLTQGATVTDYKLDFETNVLTATK